MKFVLKFFIDILGSRYYRNKRKLCLIEDDTDKDISLFISSVIYCLKLKLGTSNKHLAINSQIKFLTGREHWFSFRELAIMGNTSLLNSSLLKITINLLKN